MIDENLVQLKRVENCAHENTQFLGYQEDGNGGWIPLHNCWDCGTTVVLPCKSKPVCVLCHQPCGVYVMGDFGPVCDECMEGC